jgi:hypothetical protein
MFAVIKLALLFSDVFSFAPVAEDFHLQTFVSEFAVETFAFTVLPRTARSQYTPP